MNFTDRAIIIATKTYGEKQSIVTALTANYGIYSGMVRLNKQNQGHIMAGNLVEFFWSARLATQLGTARCELIESQSPKLMFNKQALYCWHAIAELISIGFQEREPHNDFYEYLLQFIRDIIGCSDKLLANYIKLELSLLSSSGHGLQLDRCAVSGARENLRYVSPKSGKAVSDDAAGEYRNLLLMLPEFLGGVGINQCIKQQYQHGLQLTGYFLRRYIAGEKGNNLQRDKLVPA